MFLGGQGIIQPPEGSGIRNIEAVTLSLGASVTSGTATLTTPIKEENCLIISPSQNYAIGGGPSSQYAAYVEPQTLVDGEFTEVYAERNDGNAVLDISLFVIELFGTKTLKYYQGVKATGSVAITIDSVDTSKAFVMPLGFAPYVGSASHYCGTYELTSSTEVTIDAGQGDYSFAVVEIY